MLTSFLIIVIAGITGLFLIKIELSIKASCKIVPNEPYIIKADMDGYVKKVLVEDGQYVEKSTPLFVYEDEVLKKSLNEQDLLIKDLQLRIDQLKISNNKFLVEHKQQDNQKKEQIIQMEKDISLQKNCLKSFQIERDNSLHLYNKNILESKKDLENWDYYYTVKRQQVEKDLAFVQEQLKEKAIEVDASQSLYQEEMFAESVLKAMELEYEQLKVKFESLTREKAYLESPLHMTERDLLAHTVLYNEEKFVQMQSLYESKLKSKQFVISQLQTELNEVKQNLDSYQIYMEKRQQLLEEYLQELEKRQTLEVKKRADIVGNLNKITMHAPVAGIVSLKMLKNARTSYCKKGDELARLVHLSDLRVDIYVDEKDISRVPGRGEAVYIKLNSRSHIKNRLTGQIIRIMPYTELVPVQTGPTIVNMKYFLVTASLTDVSEIVDHLLPDMEGEAKIIVEPAIYLYKYLYDILVGRTQE